ncbi:hypothetical protein LX97_02211 [Nonlabens dokdonensis]|uniref:Uncharacterized protein n=2 Tax=Nonlabens dokdonensis TaxID=328515 RepID=L7WBK5_NONDD|nr:hypothetical protein [Nonlabens dokdonensis]AGC77597.1 hypothetical protein DDD_2470 [Nonlabens dokdonensis DSW-6]PZX39853.1 hypothetical protein LX97_02211 [Nonlabens dokdonensis]
MKNIKYVTTFILLAFCFSSCTIEDDDNDGDPVEELSTDPLMGQVYGENFTVVGGTSRFLSLNGEDVIRVLLYDVQVDCTNNESSIISINLPRQIGIHEAGVTGSINDPNSTSFQSLINFKVEVVSFNNTEVTARVLIDRPSINSFVNGTFTVPFCM